MMNIENLTQNIIDQVIEAQIKLGYAKETVRLYYPLESLNAILESDVPTMEEMKKVLDGTEINDKNMELFFEIREGRMEVRVSPDSVEYIHNNVEKPRFLTELINMFATNHHLTPEQISDVFGKYDENYECRKMPEGEDFDYVFHFSDESIDGYYYCIRMEMGHTIYHRFSKQDYEAWNKV